MVIEGYIIRSEDITQVLSELKKISQNLKKESKRLYGELLGEEAAYLYDCTATNLLKEPENISFLDWSVNELNMKIQICQQKEAKNKYNFKVFAFLLPFEGNTYIKVLCYSNRLKKAFKNLEEFSLTEAESLDKSNGKLITWQKVHKRYEKENVLTTDLSPALEPKMEDIKIPSKGDRITKMARYNFTNKNLSMLSNAGQIPPYLLMPYMDTALEMLNNTELKKLEGELMAILPESEEIYKKLSGENPKE